MEWFLGFRLSNPMIVFKYINREEIIFSYVYKGFERKIKASDICKDEGSLDFSTDEENNKDVFIHIEESHLEKAGLKLNELMLEFIKDAQKKQKEKK